MMNKSLQSPLVEERPTPYYFYDMPLLRRTLLALQAAAPEKRFHVHYAMKANFNDTILTAIRQAGIGIDAVSGGEIRLAVKTGFEPSKIVFAGVGKRDDEIRYALEVGIGCFNVESIPEIRVISEIASSMGLVAPIALRLNPGIDAHTHKYITTGLAENKFGISIDYLEDIASLITELPGISLVGLHFHIGSQITITRPYELLCETINAVYARCCVLGLPLKFINVGGGLGIDYDNPDANPIPDFSRYFHTLRQGLHLPPEVEVHCELGRSIVAQCGSLISRVLYIKEGDEKRFAIIDAGFSELIRPVLYQAYHRIDVIRQSDHSSETEEYDVVGPICESTDTFAEELTLPRLSRGDILAIRSAGAYGESMSSHYNCRSLFPPLCYEGNNE